MSGQVVQALAKKAARASLTLAARGNPAIDLVRLHTILAPEAGL